MCFRCVSWTEHKARKEQEKRSPQANPTSALLQNPEGDPLKALVALQHSGSRSQEVIGGPAKVRAERDVDKGYRRSTCEDVWQVARHLADRPYKPPKSTPEPATWPAHKWTQMVSYRAWTQLRQNWGKQRARAPSKRVFECIKNKHLKKGRPDQFIIFQLSLIVYTSIPDQFHHHFGSPQKPHVNWGLNPPPTPPSIPRTGTFWFGENGCCWWPYFSELSTWWIWICVVLFSPHLCMLFWILFRTIVSWNLLQVMAYPKGNRPQEHHCWFQTVNWVTERLIEAETGYNRSPNGLLCNSLHQHPYVCFHVGFVYVHVSTSCGAKAEDAAHPAAVAAIGEGKKRRVQPWTKMFQFCGKLQFLFSWSSCPILWLFVSPQKLSDFLGVFRLESVSGEKKCRIEIKGRI